MVRVPINLRTASDVRRLLTGTHARTASASGSAKQTKVDFSAAALLTRQHIPDTARVVSNLQVDHTVRLVALRLPSEPAYFLAAC